MKEKSSGGTTDTNNRFQPGDKKRTYKTIFIGEKSSIGTTDTNNGFQPGDKKAGESLSPFPRKRGCLTTSQKSIFCHFQVYKDVS